MSKYTYRFEYWEAFLAFFNPYFFLSLMRESRLSNEFLLNIGLNSSLISQIALAIANFMASICELVPPPLTLILTS